MHIISFYSFKGGVGRTMAMVNVAFAMAKAGKRVLLVDFDLEAPGLETFQLIKAPAPNRGIVEFVAEYIKTGNAPDIRDYIYRVEVDGKLPGQIFVMPAGIRDSSYGLRLNSIDWQGLYRDRDGFVLFEDLKKQWELAFNPDYVLVDSRTGHTDVGGICTRQLPNQVVLMYFPNEQNYQGIVKVASDIRSENRLRDSDRQIELIFAASNVPEIDDEDRILENRLSYFKRAGCAPHVTIHHYQSLALLEQAVFTLSREKSRLASEYEKLRKQIIRRNIHDLEGVIAFLADRNRNEAQIPLEKLRQIRKFFENSADVHFHLARAYQNHARFAEKSELLHSALRLASGPEAHLVSRADILREIAFYNKFSSANPDPEILWALLEEPDAHEGDVRMAGDFLELETADEIEHLKSTAVYRRLTFDQKMDALDSFFDDNRKSLVRAILDDVIATLPTDMPAGARYTDQLILSLMAYGKTDLAIHVLNQPASNRHGVISDAFNYAMAMWKKTRSPDRALFEVVVKLYEERGNHDVSALPNFCQALAIAYWCAGKPQKAKEFLRNSRRAGEKEPEGDNILSAWSYLWLPKEEFLRDLDELQELISGKRERLPRVVLIEDQLSVKKRKLKVAARRKK